MDRTTHGDHAMTHTMPAPPTEGPVAPSSESYPTFWEPIPVEAAEPAEAPVASRVLPEDAYVAFLALTEDAPASSLNVVQTDVG